MSSSMKNILVLLLALTVAYAGYYMFVLNNSDELLVEGEVAYSDDMMIKAQVFIERRTILDAVELNTDIFSNPVFLSYKSFSLPIVEAEVGRENPFERAFPGGGNNAEAR